MVKFVGFSAARAMLAYIRDNSDQIFLIPSGNPTSYAACTGAASGIVSANVSAADFSIASGTPGPVLTMGAKNSQPIEGSGLANHIAYCNSSAERINYITTVSAQVLSSGNTVNLGATTITALQSANNA